LVVGYASEHVWSSWVNHQARLWRSEHRKCVVAYDPDRSGTAGSVSKGVMASSAHPVVFATPSALVSTAVMKEMTQLFDRDKPDAVIVTTPQWQALPSHPCVDFSNGETRVGGIRFLATDRTKIDTSERIVGAGV